jgi:hypothetical protein
MAPSIIHVATNRLLLNGRDTEGGQHDGPHEAAAQDELVQHQRYTQADEEL